MADFWSLLNHAERFLLLNEWLVPSSLYVFIGAVIASAFWKDTRVWATKFRYTRSIFAFTMVALVICVPPIWVMAQLVGLIVFPFVGRPSDFDNRPRHKD